MPVFQVEEQWTGRTASASSDGPRTEGRTFEVRTDTQGLSGGIVIDAVVSVFPNAAIGSPHPDWPPATCRNLTADPTDNPLMWEVVATYSESKQEQNGAGTASGPAAGTGGDSGAEGQDPSGELTYTPPKFSFRPVETQLPHDVNGKPYANTAGYPLQNAPPGYAVNGTITVPRRYPIAGTTDVAWFMALIGKSNSLAWGGFIQYELRIAGADFEPKGGWWEGNWLLEVRQELWIPTTVMSQGSMVRDVKADQVTGDPIKKGQKYRLDDLGNPMTNEVYLDDIGMEANFELPVNTPHAKSITMPIRPNTIVPGGPATIEFQQMLTANFAAIMGPYLY